MLNPSALTEAIKEHFHQIMNADPEGKRKLIDELFDYEITIHAVSRAMAEPELAA